MKILWLSHFVPFPPKGGCYQRSYNLLARIGAEHEVHLVALRHKHAVHPETETQNTLEELGKYCRSVRIVDISRSCPEFWLPILAGASMARARPFSVGIYASKEARSSIRALVSSIPFDVAHFDTIGLAQYLPEIKGLPAVVTHHGAEAHMVRRRIPNEARVLRKIYFLYEWLLLRAYEGRMCGRFAVNVVVSDDDARLLSSVAHGTTFLRVDNGVDTQYYVPGAPAAGTSLVFAGRLDQYSNRHGIMTFMNRAWPALRARFPDASIDIIGSNPPDALSQMAGPHVRVHGFVPDVRPFFRRATVAICPLWDGGGTRLKVLDALAQGTALVSTTIGCEGLDIVHERDALVVESAEEFVEQIGRLFLDAELRNRLKTNGRHLVEQRYSWDALAPRLVGAYRLALEPSRLTTPTGDRIQDVERADTRDRVL